MKFIYSFFKITSCKFDWYNCFSFITMSSQDVPQKFSVSNKQKKRNRIAKKMKKASDQEALIESRVATKESIELRITFKLIAEETAKKAIIVSERIELAKEVERKKIEKAKAEAKRFEEQKKGFYSKIDNIISSFYPKDEERIHSSFCNCDICRNIPENRKYILAYDKNYNDYEYRNLQKTVYIFLLPESCDNEYCSLAQFAIQHIYQLNCFQHISSQENISREINFRKNGKSDKYVFVGFDEKSGLPPKPFDTYLNPEFWSGINGIFTIPVQNTVRNFYENVGQSVEFKKEFFETSYSTTFARTDNSCHHEINDECDGYCPHDEDNSECPSRPKTHYTYHPDKDTFGSIFVPFSLKNSCCEKNEKNCILKCDISYKKIDAIRYNEGILQIGINIDKTFYPLEILLSKQNSINIGSISNGIFKPEELCKECELELKKNNAIVDVAVIFEMSVDEFSCKNRTKFIDRHIQTIIGENKYPIRLITGDCPNWCFHNRKTEPHYDSDDCYTQCQECNKVKRVVNSGNVLEIMSKEKRFSIFKFPEENKEILNGKTKKIMPNYLFNIKSPFTQKDIEMMFLYSICLGNLPFELIEYISQFLTIERKRIGWFDPPIVKLIELDSLENDSPNLTLAKTSIKEEEYLMKINDSVKNFYPKSYSHYDW